MATVYFLGAGASAADQLPVTNQLNFGVAEWLKASPARKRRELSGFYADIYNLSRRSITRAAEAWEEYLESGDSSSLPKKSDLPDLIETLSLIDVCISEDQSLGMSSLRNRYGIRVEMSPSFLRRVRRQLTSASPKRCRKPCTGAGRPGRACWWAR